MSLFVETINTPVDIYEANKYNSILLNNRFGSVIINLNDVLINTRLIVERLYMNDFDCFINTKKGNYILNSTESKIHLIFYNNRWLSVDRKNSLPFTTNTVNEQEMTINYFSDPKFANEILFCPDVSSNPGMAANGFFKIQNRLIVGANQFIQTVGTKGVGGFFVYSPDTSGNFNVLEEFVSIPYEFGLNQDQGNFATHICSLNMGTYDLLVVSAPNRLKVNSNCSIFVYAYKRRNTTSSNNYSLNDNSFYFERVSQPEIEISEIGKINRIFTGTSSQTFYAEFTNNVIIAYRLSFIGNSLNFTMNKITSFGSYQDMDLFDNYFYVLNNNSVVKYDVSTNPLTPLNVGTKLTSTENPSLSKIKVYSNGFIASTARKVIFYDLNGNITRTLNTTQDIQSYLFNPSMNIGTILLDGSSNNFISYRLDINNTPISNTIQSSVQNKIIFINTTNRLILATPNSGLGTFTPFTINNSSISLGTSVTIPSDTQLDETILSHDSEVLFVFHKQFKFISVFSRNIKNDYEFTTTIFPHESLKRLLRYTDLILDVAIDSIEKNIFFGIRYTTNIFPRNIRSRLIVANLLNLEIRSRFDSVFPTIGTSIDFSRSRTFYCVSDLDDRSIYIFQRINFSQIKQIKSTLPIGNKVEFSPNENEIITFANGFPVCFTDITTKERSVQLPYSVNDACYLNNGGIILSTLDASGFYHKSEKVNDCFEIMTQKDFQISEISNVQRSNMKVFPLGENYSIFYDVSGSIGRISLFEINAMKLIYQLNDQMNIEPTFSEDGSTLVYALKQNGTIKYSFYS